MIPFPTKIHFIFFLKIKWGTYVRTEICSMVCIRFFLSCTENARRYEHSPRDHFIITLSLAAEVIDVILRASGTLATNPDRS